VVVKILLKRVFLCVSVLGGAHVGWALDWENVRVIGQRLGVPRLVTVGRSPPQTIAIGDFDGDGDADIAVDGTDARRVSREREIGIIRVEASGGPAIHPLFKGGL
jgi:hypothetical protein